MFWITAVFVPEVNRRRAELEVPEQRAFLMMDNCSAHTTPEVLAALDQNNIQPVFIPPHASHIYQPLDRCMFAAFEAHLRSAIPEEADRQTARGGGIRASGIRASGIRASG